MGNLSEGSRITLTPGESGETLTAAVYRFSPRAMIQVHDRLSQSPLHLDSWRDTKLTGTVTAAESGTLFLSIPYDEGWTITIDGQPAEGKKILEAFLSVPVEAGTHEISLNLHARRTCAGSDPFGSLPGSPGSPVACKTPPLWPRRGVGSSRRAAAPYGKNRCIPDTRRFFSVLISIWKGGRKAPESRI